jgi:hypothetical protein
MPRDPWRRPGKIDLQNKVITEVPHMPIRHEPELLPLNVGPTGSIQVISEFLMAMAH